MHDFKPGDRVYVTDPGLAMLRELYERFKKKPAPPNHYGTVAGVDVDGETIIIGFDGDNGEHNEGSLAPYPVDQVHHLEEA